MLPKLLLTAVLVLLTACSTSYTVPTQNAPDVWQDKGAYGLQYIEGTLEHHEGLKQQGDALLEFGVEQLRTATIVQDIVWKDKLGRERSIAAGTPAYAAQFTFIKSINNGRKGYSQNMNARNNPIEWCVPFRNKATCIFWEGPDQARYIDAMGGVPMRAVPIGGDGVRGPMPELREGDVNFERSLKVEVVIQSLRKSRIDIQTNYTDGVNSVLISDRHFRRYNWDDNNQTIVTTYGATFRLTLLRDSGSNVVDVELLSVLSEDEDDSI